MCSKCSQLFTNTNSLNIIFFRDNKKNNKYNFILLQQSIFWLFLQEIKYNIFKTYMGMLRLLGSSEFSDL